MVLTEASGINLLTGVNHVMTRFDPRVPAAANPEGKHVSSVSWRGV
jgi:hypothetical protein